MKTYSVLKVSLSYFKQQYKRYLPMQNKLVLTHSGHPVAQVVPMDWTTTPPNGVVVQPPHGYIPIAHDLTNALSCAPVVPAPVVPTMTPEEFAAARAERERWLREELSKEGDE